MYTGMESSLLDQITVTAGKSHNPTYRALQTIIPEHGIQRVESWFNLNLISSMKNFIASKKHLKNPCG